MDFEVILINEWRENDHTSGQEQLLRRKEIEKARPRQNKQYRQKLACLLSVWLIVEYTPTG